ncbi:hypothetical protein [Paenibacillus ginsengarvi]|uniref:Uncharacterized protein n=1 Tax=Paenibacillus ginsengarvi TaxID=400777 RepID=A0A3B0CJU4_9BACL|nr:hypothetical protein [Paenibacillus ginsengarvi]RKN84804.1 hypothetical protein D7M11_12545 [Paenibacillus ginsengarvi]
MPSQTGYQQSLNRQHASPAPARAKSGKPAAANGAAALQSGPLSANLLLQLQRTHGNQATGAYIRSMNAGVIQRGLFDRVKGVFSRSSSNSNGGQAQQTGDEDKLGEGLETAGEVTDTFSQPFGDTSDDLAEVAYDEDDNVKDAGMAKTSGGIGTVGGTADMLGGVFKLMSSIRETVKIVQNKDGKSTANQAFHGAEQVSGVLEGGGKAVSGSTKLVDSAAKANGQLQGVGSSSSVSEYAGTVGEGLTALKEAVGAVVNIYKMYNKHKEEGGLSKTDVAKGSLETIKGALEAASSSLKVAKSVLELMESGTGALTSAIPGVSIAVSGMKIAFQVAAIIKANIGRESMQLVKRSFKEKHADADFIIPKSWFGGNAGVDKQKLEDFKRDLPNKIAASETRKDALETKQTELDAKQTDVDNELTAKQDEKKSVLALTNKTQAEKRALLAPINREIQKLTTKKTSLATDIANNKESLDKEIREYTRLSEFEQASTEYKLAKELKYINKKRITRGSLIGLTEMIKIGGDIATLTGVGAQVGTPLKIVATGFGAAMPAVRTLKQAGRDRASKTGASSLTKWMFDENKSSDKKKLRREADTDLIIAMFSSLPVFDPSNNGVVGQYEHVKKFVEATGMNWSHLEKVQSDPDKLKEAMIAAMAER